MRSKKAIRNLVFNILQQIILIITNFIITPILVVNFGSTVNGLVSTIKQIMNYVQLAGAGIAQSSVYAMYNPIAQKDESKLNGIYSATRILFNKAGNVFSIITLIIAIVYPFFLKETDYLTIFLLVIVMAIAGASEFYLCGKYTAILTALQDNFIIAAARIFGCITNFIFLIIFVHLKQNIIVVQLGMSSVYVIRIIIMYTYLKKHYPALSDQCLPRFDLITQRGDVIIHQITGLVVGGSSTLFASVICGLKQASVFSVYSLIFTAINTMCTIISNAIYSSFGEILAKKEVNTLKHSYNIFEFVYFIIMAIVFSVTYIMIMPLIFLYTKNMVDANYYLPYIATLFVIVGIINNIRYPCLTLVIAAGHYKETRNKAIIETIINIIGQILLGLFFGLTGLLMGCIISYGYRTIDFIFYTNEKILNQSPKKTLLRIFINIMVGAILCVITGMVKFDISGYFEWFLYAVFLTSVFSFIIIGVNGIFDKKSFLEVFSFIKRLFQI